MTIENNILIADFIGLKKYGDREYLSKEGAIYAESSLRFHYDWSWLMPVVEKIESLEINTKYKNDSVYLLQYPSAKRGSTIYYSRFVSETTQSWYIADCEGFSKIDATYNCVVNFIKWINTNENKTKI